MAKKLKRRPRSPLEKKARRGFRGYPVATLLRGKPMVWRGQLLGKPSDGRWLPRRVRPEILAGPAL